MSASFVRRLSLLPRPWKPLEFLPKAFIAIPKDQQIEEQYVPHYVPAEYYPARIGRIFKDRYQVVGNLGYGRSSTVWLARDFAESRHVALKLHIRSQSMGDRLGAELDVYKRLENVPPDHPGRHTVRSLLDCFHVDGPDGQHQCLVHLPLWEDLYSIRHRNPIAKLPKVVVATVLRRLFYALDLLHTECRVTHTDISENEELQDPSPRKELDDRTIYVSREMNIPKSFGAPVLCDFGAAVALDDGKEHREDIQPNIYRCPEVILDLPWTYSADIWNVGCVIWDLLQGESLFTGEDPELNTYRGRAHLAEMIALLGSPPPTLLARANLRSKFFSDEGVFNAGIPIPESRMLEQRETALLEEGDAEDRALFFHFMRKMLQWEPNKRSTARELIEDEWIVRNAK